VQVAVLCPGFDASISSIEQALDVLDQHGTDELGFLQMFNLHRYSSAVRELVTSPRLAKVAAELLGAPKVRLYQVRKADPQELQSLPIKERII
jgi:hypothetical protein